MILHFCAWWLSKYLSPPPLPEKSMAHNKYVQDSSVMSTTPFAVDGQSSALPHLSTHLHL